MKKLRIIPIALCVSLLTNSTVFAAESSADNNTEITPTDAIELPVAEGITATDARNEYTNSTYEEYVTGTMDSNKFPSSYDLRDRGVVTPVKLQYPFGTCWAFGSVAAAEISILSKLGMTCDEFEQKYGFPMDLSERQVAFFAHKAIPETESDTYNNQGGEGTYYLIDSKNKEMGGGTSSQAGDIFSDGTGAVFEQYVPYHGKDAITAIETTSRGSQVLCYSEEDNWNVAEDYRIDSNFSLLNCSELVCPAYRDENGGYTYNPYGTYEIKSALYDGNGVAIGFYADNSMPGKPTTTAYMNTAGEQPTWAHYTYDAIRPNHEVCIVGWDDNYPASNFTEGHQPPADGAWIVKNSWGSLNSDETNTCNWGYEGSGYFYLSYYDKSLDAPTVFDFDVTDFLSGETVKNNYEQYDYTITELMYSASYDEEIAAANVFTVDEDSSLTSITVDTEDYNSKIIYSIYKLSDGSDTPQESTPLMADEVQIKYAGTHMLELPSPISFNKGDRIAVVVKDVTTSADGSETYKLCVNAVWGEDAIRTLYDPKNEEGNKVLAYQKAVVNPGESFVFFRGNWYDWNDLTTEMEGGKSMVEFDNFTIKATFVP